MPIYLNPQPMNVQLCIHSQHRTLQHELVSKEQHNERAT